MSGGGTQTSVTQNGPPPEYLAAYNNLMNRANLVAATPYQPYPGQLQAGFSPMQQQGFDTISSAPGITAPYINSAAQHFDAASQPLDAANPYLGHALGSYVAGRDMPILAQSAPYTSSSAANYNAAAGANLNGAIQPFQSAASAGFGANGQPLSLQQYSGNAVSQFYNPYNDAVVNATAAQFAQQNAQQQNQFRGNAASQGALGGDRLGVAQAELAGQQQMAQAPVLANLRAQGFGQAQQEFNTQQAQDLAAQAQSRGFGLQAASGFAGLGNQALQAAQGQGQLQMGAGQGLAGLAGLTQSGAAQEAQQRLAAGQGLAGLGQLALGQQQGSAWLNSQAGAGMAGLGQEALSSTLGAGNALLGAGGLQQQQAQQSLNIPYQQYLASQAYPFQTTGWLGNLVEGLGGASGGTSTQSMPAPSAASQIGGAALTGASLIGATGGFGSNGWLSNGVSNLFSGGGGADNLAYNAATSPLNQIGSYGPGFGNRGGAAGAIGGFGRAPGGSVPSAIDIPIDMGAVPGDFGDPEGGFGVPDAGTSPVSGASGFGTPARTHRAPIFLSSTGTTTTRKGGDSVFGSLLKTAGNIAAGIYGGPAGGLAASYLGSQVHFDRGGGLHRAPGGSVPILTPGFGGNSPISIQVLPGSHGQSLPRMMVNGFGAAPAAAPGGSAALNGYLANTAAGAFHGPSSVPAVPTPPAPAGGTGGPSVAAPSQDDINKLVDARLSALDTQKLENHSADQNGGGGLARGGMAQGFGGSQGHFLESGLLHTAGPGRTDNLNIHPLADSYVIPADVVSGLGEGNTLAGAKAIEMALSTGPHGVPMPQAGGRFHMRGFADGGDIGDDFGDDYLAQMAAPDDALPLPPDPAPGFGGRSRGIRGHAPSQIPLPPPPPPDDSAPTSAPADSGTSASMWSDDDDGGPAPSSGFGASPRSGGLSNFNGHADPWLALLTAGAATMAGTSRNAGVNLGRGLAAGAQQYASSEQQARALATRIDEARARLAETQAWHQGTLASRDRGQDIRFQQAQMASDDRRAKMEQAATLAMIHAANRAGGHATPGDNESAAISDALKMKDADGNPMFGGRAEAYRFVRGIDDRARHMDNQDEASATRNDIMASKNARVVALQEQGMDLKAAKQQADQEFREKQLQFQRDKEAATEGFRGKQLQGQSENTLVRSAAYIAAATGKPIAKVLNDLRGAARNGAPAASAAQAGPRNPPTVKPNPLGGPAQPKSQADYDALPPGSIYLDPQGNQRRKGN